MAVGYGVPVPKGKTVKQLRSRAKRQDRKAMKAWRDAAWKAQPGGDDIYQWGICADCSCIVYRTCYQPVGHVHHVRSRRHKETRTAASNAEIVCRGCHQKRHGREF